jgi:hypothetical protein
LDRNRQQSPSVESSDPVRAFYDDDIPPRFSVDVRRHVDRLPDGPLLGTFFTKDQNKPGADKVVVLTRSCWQTQYQESPEVLGKEVRIDDEAYKVIGVGASGAGSV